MKINCVRNFRLYNYIFAYLTFMIASSRSFLSFEDSTADRARVLYADNCDIRRLFSFSKQTTRDCNSSIFRARSRADI